MRRDRRPRAALVVLVALLSWPAAAAAEAQGRPPEAAAERPAAGDDRREVQSGEAHEERDRRRPRRRRAAYSKIGYIDPAVVASRLRIRLDAASGNRAPDRAEFFYAKCGCFRITGLDPAAPGPAPGNDPFAVGLRIIETGVDYQDLWLDLEHAFNRRLSVFVELPFRSLDPEINANASGLGDVRAGMKVAFVARPERYLTFQLRAFLPTGDAGDGLGTDHVSLEPALLLYQELSPRATLEAELALWHPVGGSSDQFVTLARDRAVGAFAADVLRYGIGVGFDLGRGRRVSVSPVAELVGWRVTGGYRTVSRNGFPDIPPLFPLDATGILAQPAGDDQIANLKLGARVGLSGGDSVYVGYGFPLTGDEWYDSILRFEYRRPLGRR